ncbi:MAG: MucR family transcriptional regulator [bacterium]|nr:MucR family transcriptional regulator [bacterium]
MQKTIIKATAKITAGYFKSNKVEPEKITDIIENIYSHLISISDKTTSYTLNPFVDPKDSVKPDYIVCLEDGKKLKMLKRYLKAKYNMTEVEYKEKWGLPKDYPMVAPNYAKKRSNLAKKSGFGQR